MGSPTGRAGSPAVPDAPVAPVAPVAVGPGSAGSPESERSKGSLDKVRTEQERELDAMAEELARQVNKGSKSNRRKRLRKSLLIAQQSGELKAMLEQRRRELQSRPATVAGISQDDVRGSMVTALGGLPLVRMLHRFSYSQPNPLDMFLDDADFT